MISDNLYNISLTLNTSDDVFSPSAVDTGTKAMLSYVSLTKEDKVLDLGCGYGVVGIWAAKQIGSDHVVMCDISDSAIECARSNAELNQVLDGLTIKKSNGLTDITEEGFTFILSNPPYHVDFSVPKNFIEQGYKKLAYGGKMVMVTKRKDWYKNKLVSTFGGVKINEKDGYYIFIAEKRKKAFKPVEKPAQKLSKKLARKYK